MEQNDLTKKRIVSLSKTLSIVFKVLAIICLIGCALGIIFVIAGIFIPYTQLQNSIIDFMNEYAPNENQEFIKYINVGNAEIIFMSTSLTSASSMFLLYYVYRLFNDIKINETPFTDNVVKFLNLIGILALVSAIAVPIFLSIFTNIVPHVGNFNSFGLNVSFVIVGLILFALSLIFKYGVQLQKESDTTL